MEYDVAPEAYLHSLSALAFFAKTYSLEFLGKEDVKLKDAEEELGVTPGDGDGKKGGTTTTTTTTTTTIVMIPSSSANRRCARNSRKSYTKSTKRMR